MLSTTAIEASIDFTFCAAPALSAEFPKTGNAEYDTYYVDNVLAKIDIGFATGSIVDETGITRNVKGEGPFHEAALKPTKMVTTYSQSSTTKTTT